MFNKSESENFLSHYLKRAFCCPMQLTKHSETRGGINEKTISHWSKSNKNSHWFMRWLNENYLLELNSMKLLIAYIFLLAGIFLGILANGYFLKMSGGFTKLLPSIACGIIILLAVFCLSRAMNTIPVGFTYATYGGLTIIGVTLFGIIKYNQTPNIYGSIGIVLILIGVVLVNYLGRINS